jgi:hypothetical protein
VNIGTHAKADIVFLDKVDKIDLAGRFWTRLTRLTRLTRSLDEVDKVDKVDEVDSAGRSMKSMKSTLSVLLAIKNHKRNSAEEPNFLLLPSEFLITRMTPILPMPDLPMAAPTPPGHRVPVVGFHPMGR